MTTQEINDRLAEIDEFTDHGIKAAMAGAGFIAWMVVILFFIQ